MDIQAARQQLYEAAIVDVFRHEDDGDGFCAVCEERLPCEAWRAIELSKILEEEGDQ